GAAADPFLSIVGEDCGAFVTGAPDQVWLALAFVYRPDVMNDVQRFVQHHRRPRPFHGILRDWEREDADRSAVHPVGFLRTVAAHQRGEDDRRFAAAVNVGRAYAVNRRLLGNRVQRPLVVESLSALQPLQRAAALGVERGPVGAEHDVELSVAIDVQSAYADVIRLRRPGQDGAHFPGRVLVPDDAMLIDHDNVRLAVAVEVRDRDGVADLQTLFEFLRTEARDRIGRGRDRLHKAKQNRWHGKAGHGGNPGGVINWLDRDGCTAQCSRIGWTVPEFEIRGLDVASD